MQTLLGDILDWDGKSKTQIQKVFEDHCQEADFSRDLISLLAEPNTQVGSSWLLKHGLENDQFQLTGRQISNVYQKLGKLEGWGAKLHILQCFGYLPPPASQKQRIHDFLDECLSDDNKFVRAWTYSGFFELARYHPVYREEVSRILQNGMESESAASVKVRIRKAIEAGFDS